MAKQQENPALEIFANLRTILIFVVLGSTIVGFVEYKSQSDANKTYKKWSGAITDSQEEGTFLSLVDFNRLIAGYPKQMETKKPLPPPSEKEKKVLIGINTKEKPKTDEEKSKAEEEKKAQEKIKEAATKIVNYTWSGLFSKSMISVSMSGGEEPVVYRVSAIQH